jgi:hypothetical protein
VPASPAVAAYVTTYSAHTPYITLKEWLAAPTAVDISDMIPGGTTAQQQQAVQDKIERASSWVDDLCLQVLAATRDTTYGRYRVNRWGTMKIPLQFKPVLEVSAVSVGVTPSTMTPLASLVDVAILPRGTIEVPVAGVNIPGQIGATRSSDTRMLVSVTYVNGFPNTITTAASLANATSLVLDSVLGIYPGTPLTVYDVTTGGTTEHVTVASTYIAGSPTITLAAPLLYAHPAGMSVSSLPPRVKEAAILLTTALIQTRGNDAIVLDSSDSPSKTSAQYGASAAGIALAKEMLVRLRRSA